MITAKEMLEMTTTKSKLAKVTIKEIEQVLELKAKPEAIKGKRYIKMDMQPIYFETEGQFTYSEISNMCDEILTKLGYACQMTAKHILTIYW